MRIGDTVIVGGPRSKLGIAPMANDLEFNSTSPETMIKFSDAVTLLSTGMWGGLSRPTPVIAAKKITKRHQLGLALGGSQRDNASQLQRLMESWKSTPFSAVQKLGQKQSRSKFLSVSLLRVAVFRIMRFESV